MSADLQPEQKSPTAHVSYYFGDQQALDTLGVSLKVRRRLSASSIGSKVRLLPRLGS